VLLCSDGLWNYLKTPEGLGEIVVGLGGDASPATVARALTEFARGAGGHDNITVAVAALSGPKLVSAVDEAGLETRSGASRAVGQG
jgi:serine/threonine protein phosphatase PrpC